MADKRLATALQLPEDCEDEGGHQFSLSNTVADLLRVYRKLVQLLSRLLPRLCTIRNLE